MASDGTLASGKSRSRSAGTSSLIAQGNPGFYPFPSAVLFDSVGLESHAYASWSGSPTWPLGSVTKGSDNKFYLALSATTNVNPVGDAGVHWLEVTFAQAGASNGQTLRWDATAHIYQPSSLFINDGSTLTAATSLDMGSNKVTSTYVPINGPDLVNKTYADGLVVGITDAHLPAVLVVTANVTRSGEQTIDGVLTSATRVLLVGQTDKTQNGLFTTGAGAWTRTADADAVGELKQGSFVLVTSGTTLAGSGWFLTTTGTITPGTTAQTWIELIAPLALVQGNGILISGTTISANPDLVTLDFTGTALEVKAGGIGSTQLANSGVTAATYDYGFKATYDAKGRATAATNSSGTKDANHFLNGVGAFAAIDVSQVTNSGTVTTFTAGTLSPLFTTSVATASTTPALTFALTNAAQNALFAGPASGGAGAPSYRAQVPLDWAASAAAGKLAYAVDGTTNGWSNAPTTGQTLRASGTTPTWNSFLANSGTQVTINSPASPTAGIPLVVKSATGVNPGIEIEAEAATDATSFNLNNTANSAVARLGLAANANDYITGAAASDVVLSQFYASKRMWIGSKVAGGDSNTTAIAVFDQNGVAINSTAAAGAALDVTAHSGAMAALLTGANAQKGLVVAGTAAVPTVDITNTSTRCLDLTNSATPAGNAGALMSLNSAAAATALGSRYGGILFGKNVAGTLTSLALIAATSEEDNTTNKGVKIGFQIGLLGGTTLPTRVEFRGNGDVALNAGGSAVAASATGGFAWMPNCAGTPTGVPANSYTGATPMLVDATGKRIMLYASGWQDSSTGVPVTVAASSNTYTPDASAGKHFRLTLAATNTIAAPTNPTDGQKIILEIIQDATGSRTVTWNSVYQFGPDVPQPTLSTTANKHDLVGFIYSSSLTKWLCAAVTRGFN